MKLIFFLILYFQCIYGQEDEGVLCTVQTCITYVSANPCPELSDNCKIQNTTHNGLFLPSPDPCNCCKYCLQNLKEGDYCAQGDVGGLIPDSICGPGLSCSPDGVCIKMTEITTKDIPPCSKAQADYDKRRNDGTLGRMEERPDCDDDGYFKPYKCVPGQTCFCVDKNGVRIFGEIPYKSTAKLILKCECSRKYYEIVKFLGKDSLNPDQFFRCTEVGDYDTIQCIGDNCMCTDASDGAPTFPTADTVDIKNITNSSLPDCFNKDIHETGKYYHDCAENYLKVLKEVNDYKDSGYNTVFEVEYPQCDLDGNYAPVKKDVRLNPNTNEPEEYYVCVKPDGSLFDENYEVTDPTNMDCKCARTRYVMPDDALEKPECCLNGNFNEVQCRRGQCYCVNTDGYQKIQSGQPAEVDILDKTTLPCYSDSKQEKCLGQQ